MPEAMHHSITLMIYCSEVEEPNLRDASISACQFDNVLRDHFLLANSPVALDQVSTSFRIA